MASIPGIFGAACNALSVATNNVLATVPANSTQGASTNLLLSPFSNLNLSSAQQTQISTILQNAQSKGLSPQQVQSQLDAVLTPAQQAQLQQNLRQDRHHRGSGITTDAGTSDGTDAFGIPTSITSGSSTATQSIGAAAAYYALQSQLQGNQD